MKKRIAVLIIALSVFSCSKEKQTMNVNVDITGLQKGTIYLQKLIDTTYTTVDSITLNSRQTFTLSDTPNIAELYYIVLKENPEEVIPFFGEAGEININSKLEKFATSAQIKGSESQVLYEEYKGMISNFNNKNVELIKQKFDAQVSNDSILLNQADEDLARLTKNRLRYAANFAIQHHNSNVAPYVALTELYEAPKQLLINVDNELTDDVKNSTYGKILSGYLKQE